MKLNTNCTLEEEQKNVEDDEYKVTVLPLVDVTPMTKAIRSLHSILQTGKPCQQSSYE